MISFGRWACGRRSIPTASTGTTKLLAATGGEGVDVVLNSLAGRHIALCLEALRPGGWHCEIGKVDIYADSALSLSVFRKNLRFAAIDVDRLMNDDPYLTRELSQACLDLLERGAVPPLPITTYPYRDYEEPLRLMTTGQHTGKLVLQAPGTAGGEPPPVADLRPYLDAEATYLVTGGFGGFGRLLLPYLATAGGAPHHPARPRSEAPPQRRQAAQDQRTLVPPGRYPDRHRHRRRRRGSRRAALRCRPAAPAEGRVPLGRRPGRLPAGRPHRRVAGQGVRSQGARRPQPAPSYRRLRTRPLRAVLVDRLDARQPGPGQLQRRQQLRGRARHPAPAPGPAGAVLQPRRRGRGRDGRPQSARAAHEPRRRRTADQRRLRHHQPRLRHARDDRPRPPGHRPVLAPALDRRFPPTTCAPGACSATRTHSRSTPAANSPWTRWWRRSPTRWPNCAATTRAARRIRCPASA